MKVTVHYLAQLRAAAGLASEAIDLDGAAALPDLIRRLVERHNDAFRRILLDDAGQLRNSILLFVGDEQSRGEPRPLQDGNVVTVLAPMAGGEAPIFKNQEPNNDQSPKLNLAGV